MLHALRTRLARWLSPPPLPAAPAPEPAQRRPMAVTRTLLERMSSQIVPQPGAQFRKYALPDLPPGVLPSKAVFESTPAVLAHDELPRVALDDAGSVGPAFGWLNGFNSLGCGLWFPGYPYLAELTQISEYRAPSETTSTEMTRKWLEVVSKGSGDKSDKISKITKRMGELKVRELFTRAALLDGFFGRAQIIMSFKTDDDRTRQLPLDISPAGVRKGSLQSLQCIEPYWSTPYSWNASYPERSDFYKPQSWYIMGRKTHATRLLTFIGREVPDILKPAYNFGGMSLTQLMQPYVNAWLRTRKSVNDLINNFSVTMLATDMSTTLEDGNDGSGLLNRLQMFTLNRNNQGVGAINKDSEEIVQVNTPLSGLSELQAQSQEHMSAPAHIPLIKMFGVTPTGLNATGEGEIKVWYDHVGAMQQNLFGPQMEILLKVLQLDLFGAIDDELGFQWAQLDEPTGKELSEIRKSDADAGVAYINAGVISPDEERERLQDDPDSGYNNLNGPAPEPQPDPNMEMQLEHDADQADQQRQHEAATAAAAPKPGEA